MPTRTFSGASTTGTTWLLRLYDNRFSRVLVHFFLDRTSIALEEGLFVDVVAYPQEWFGFPQLCCFFEHLALRLCPSPEPLWRYPLLQQILFRSLVDVPSKLPFLFLQSAYCTPVFGSGVTSMRCANSATRAFFLLRSFSSSMTSVLSSLCAAVGPQLSG